MDFEYTARTKTGTIQKDVMTAFNEKAVADALRNQGLIPTSITEFHPGVKFDAIFSGLQRVKLIDKITFIKNLAVMLKAGLPLSRCMKILTTQTPNAKFRKILLQISHQVESGNSLSDSMGNFGNVFPPVFISMVRVGESSGTLETTLSYLGDQMQRDYDLVSKAKGAMTYPIVIMIALVIVGFLMFTFVLPKLTETFEDFGTELPFMTKVVIGLVNIIAGNALFIFLGMIAFAAAFIYWRKTPAGRQILHKLVFYIPLISGIVIKINVARFVRVFASLIKSGMPIVESLEVASKVVENIYYQRTIADAASRVKIGSPLTMAFKKQPDLFPNLVVEMMEVGEESGTTDTVLMEVAAFYEQEVDQTMKNLSSVLEPVLMMIIGGVVGFLAVALITPIYNITQSV